MTGSMQSKKSVRQLARFTLLLFAGITLVKILVFLALMYTGKARPFIGDNAANLYIPSARRILAEGRFNGPDSRDASKVAPAYSAVLAVFMMAAPRNYAAVAVCFQMMADMATAILLCWLGTRFVRSGVGMLAGLIWLLYPPAVAISTWITAETLFTTLLVGGAAAFLLSMATRRALLFLLTGLLFGVANLTRGTTTLVPVLLAAVSVRRRLVSSTAIFLTAFALVFTSWYIRNRVVLDDPIPVSVGFGGAFLQGSDERLFTIEGKHATYPEIYAEAARAGVVKPVTDHESVIDHWLFEVGMNNYRMRLAQRPFSFVTLAIDKFFRLWYSTESGGWKGQLLIGLCSLPVVLPGLWRLARWVRRGSDFALVCGVITVYFIGLHLVTGPLNRYMVPMYPILLLAACDWWLDLWSSQSKEQPSVAMSAAPSMHV